MNENTNRIDVSEAELAHLGEGLIAYLREIDSGELARKFPGIPPIAPGTRLWALFGADGRPILLSDEREQVLAGAVQHELTPVSVH